MGVEEEDGGAPPPGGETNHVRRDVGVRSLRQLGELVAAPILRPVQRGRGAEVAEASVGGGVVAFDLLLVGDVGDVLEEVDDLVGFAEVGKGGGVDGWPAGGRRFEERGGGQVEVAQEVMVGAEGCDCGGGGVGYGGPVYGAVRVLVPFGCGHCGLGGFVAGPLVFVGKKRVRLLGLVWLEI